MILVRYENISFNFINNKIYNLFFNVRYGTLILYKNGHEIINLRYFEKESKSTNLRHKYCFTSFFCHQFFINLHIKEK